MMDCKVCMRRGMIPRCPFCGRKATIRKSRAERQLDKIQRDSLAERVRLDQLAFDNFKKVNAEGSGVESFDEEVRNVIGDWKL